LCFFSIQGPLSRMGKRSDSEMLSAHGEASAEESRWIGGFIG